jgi:serine acetyltransferase
MTPGHEISPRIIAQTLAYDGFTVLALTRLRQAAAAWRVPLANRALRTAQMVFYGIEISKAATRGLARGRSSLEASRSAT